MRDLAELFHHRCDHFLHGLRARELICVREEIAFESLGLRIKIGDQSRIGHRDLQKLLLRSEARILHCLRDVEHVEAFGDDDGVDVNIAVNQSRVDINRLASFSKRYSPAFKDRL